MAGFGFDDDDFSLSGLMQEGHDSVMVINSSSLMMMKIMMVYWSVLAS